MAAVNIDWVLLPEDLAIEDQAEEKGEDNSDEEEGVKSPESWELSQQIDSHVAVLDGDQLRTRATMSDQIAQPMVTSEPPPNNPLADQEAPTTTPLAIVTPDA